MKHAICFYCRYDGPILLFVVLSVVCIQKFKGADRSIPSVWPCYRVTDTTCAVYSKSAVSATIISSIFPTRAALFTRSRAFLTHHSPCSWTPRCCQLEPSPTT